jgi:serine/threonine protein phosphatase PrpC
MTPNEDVSAFVPRSPDQGVLIVADGLGGHANGGQASRLAVEQVVKSLENLDPQVEELRPAILDGIESANTAVCALGNGSASTLAIAEIRSGVVRTYHVGDSAILLTGSRGRIKLQTIAHSPIGYAVESGMIDEADAIYHEDRHMISNVIGTNNMRIEIGSPIRMAPRDRLVLASDGLLDNLFPHEIVEMVRIGPVSRAVVRLAGEALSRMVTESANVPSKPDDLTIIGFGLTR